MAKPVVAVVTGIGVRSVTVGKVTVAMGPVAVGAVENPGISFSLRVGFSFSLSSGFPLLPCLLHSGLLSSGRSDCSRDDSDKTTVGTRHHSTSLVLASGSSSVYKGSVGVGHDRGRGGVGEWSPVGVGKVVAGGIRESWVSLSIGAHGG